MLPGHCSPAHGSSAGAAPVRWRRAASRHRTGPGGCTGSRSGPTLMGPWRHGEAEDAQLRRCPGPGTRCGRLGRGIAASGGTQALGCPAGGRCLGGVPLGCTQVSDGLGQRDEADDEPDLLGGWGVARIRRRRQQPRRVTHAVARRSGAEDAPVGGAGGTVISVRGLADLPAAKGCGGDVQGVSGPGCIGRRSRIDGGEVADLRRAPAQVADQRAGGPSARLSGPPLDRGPRRRRRRSG